MREMTVEDVIRRVAVIRSIAGDDEQAHGDEDRLWEDVLRAIAVGHAHPADLAREALKTLDIEFSRWRA